MIVVCNIEQCPHRSGNGFCNIQVLSIKDGTCKELRRLQEGREPANDNNRRTE